MKDGKRVAKVIGTHNNVYVFDESRVSFNLRKKNEPWLWNMRLGHNNFDNLIKVRNVGFNPIQKLPAYKF